MYVPAGITPSLFKHVSRPRIFSLVVDDFGVKWENSEDLDHLIACLRKLCEINVKLKCKLYVGITLNWHYNKGFVDLSMPGCIKRAFKRFDIAEVLQPVHIGKRCS